ncbi:MAG: prealbumin-like fold domain-containing protein, partial [Finegoldia magna]|nr:prealbumin-like fold domain-containing protein [Finegoldia magna]
SKHHAPKAGIKEITYNFYTPVQGMQEKYMMDISIILTAKNKVGAKRFVMNGWPADKVKEATPIRSGMNNRTTVLGEFKSESEARWTVTDAISTGDDKGTKEKPADTKLPWETRKLSDNQTLQKGQVAVYKIDTTSGKMVQVGQTQQNVNPMPEKGENPNTNQTVGTIAVYGYDTSFNTDEKKPLSLAGVMISKYKDIYVNQNWNLDQGLNMPAQTLKAVDPSDSKNELGSTSVDEETPGAQASRSITIPTVKVWNIQGERKFTKTQPKIVQTFPTDKTHNDKTISYYENHNYYDPNTKGYNIHNRGTVEEVPNRASFTIVKTDKSDSKKKLAGAKFKLLGGPEVITDANGEAVFNNIAPGTYTIFETKAPNGYKSNQENATINIDKEGRVSLEGGPASISAGANPTQTVEHGGYPDYMNAMQYATKDNDGNVTTYIFLKANEEQRGGSTDRDTRLNLRMDNGSITNVEVFDVYPDDQRNPLKTAMTQQTADKMVSQLGASVLNSPHGYPIKGKANVIDPFTNNEGYQISLPKERFANDWGFLVKVTGKGDSLTYDWLTNEDTGKQAKLQDQKIVPSTSNDTDKATKITITNEAFETRQVGLTKLDKGNNPVAGATFVIKDENGDVISTVTSDKDGKVSFGDMPGGKYTIEETEAPAGYVKSDVIFEVTVDDSKQLTYIPKFKNGNGYPVNGEDYFIKDIEQGQDDSRAKVTSVTQDLYVNDKENGSIGRRPGIWEAYFLESLSYTAKINLDNSAPGTRFSIQF